MAMTTSTTNFDSKKRKSDESGLSPPVGPADSGSSFLLPDGNGSSVPSYLTRDSARLMVDVLSKEDLANIVLSATLRYREILDEVRSIADRDPAHRKIFVRGLSWETSSHTLRNTFSEFGELEEAITIMDRNTGKSRGYGFVTFRHMDGAINALREPSKRIDGRICVCQLASVGSAATQPPQDLAARKIYVGNVPLAWPVDRLLSIFSEYGDIEEGPLGLDKQVGKERGFALFIYKTAEATKRALEDPVKTIDGHQLFCKLAVEGAKQRVPMHGQSDMPTFGSMSSNMHYGGGQYGTMPQGAPYNHNAPVLNQGMSSAMHPNAGGSAQSVTSSASGNPAHGQPLNIAGSQIGTTMAYGGHGTADMYGSQGGSYSGQPTGYSNVGPYNGAVTSQTSAFQGQYGMHAYQNQQQLSSYQTQQQQTASARAPPTGVPLTPYYGM